MPYKIKKYIGTEDTGHILWYAGNEKHRNEVMKHVLKSIEREFRRCEKNRIE